MNASMKIIGGLLLTWTLAAGCTGSQGNVGNLQTYPVPSMEAPWIRAGDPISFEGEDWHPQDGIEGLQDSEVYLMGEYKGVQFFVDKLDVRPYDRLYTKFSKNKYRYFERKQE